MNREEAWKLFCEFNETDALRKHALAVEGVMRYWARKSQGDEELWGVVGLLHDLDYEKWPEEHCVHSERILRERNCPEEILRAVLSHAWGVCTEVEPQSEMEKVLYAIDELTGLVAATALVRPSKSVLDTKVKSVKKKWKNAVSSVHQQRKNRIYHSFQETVYFQYRNELENYFFLLS